MMRFDVEFFGGVIVGIVLGFVLSLGVAKAEDHDHDAMGAAGKFYETWKLPNGGAERVSSCCNQKDCYATAIKNVGGTWFGRVRETGKWAVIPDDKLEELQADERVSPDGQSHMCANPHGVVYCAVRGDGI